MHTYSPTRRSLSGLAGLTLVIETGFSVGHLVSGAHPASGIWLAGAVFVCACWWIYQCALIVATGKCNPAFDMPLFGSRAPDHTVEHYTAQGRVVGVIRPTIAEATAAPGPRLDPNRGRRFTPWRSRKAS
jgi:hypothetical protein